MMRRWPGAAPTDSGVSRRISRTRVLAPIVRWSWLYSSATGVQVVYLGLIPLPDLVPKDKALASVLKAVHVALNLGLFTLVCVHIAAALKHHFVDHDQVLARMLPGIKPKGTAG